MVPHAIFGHIVTAIGSLILSSSRARVVIQSSVVGKQNSDFPFPAALYLLFFILTYYDPSYIVGK